MSLLINEFTVYKYCDNYYSKEKLEELGFDYFDEKYFQRLIKVKGEDYPIRLVNGDQEEKYSCHDFIEYGKGYDRFGINSGDDLLILDVERLYALQCQDEICLCRSSLEPENILKNIYKLFQQQCLEVRQNSDNVNLEYLAQLKKEKGYQET